MISVRILSSSLNLYAGMLLNHIFIKQNHADFKRMFLRSLISSTHHFEFIATVVRAHSYLLTTLHVLYPNQDSTSSPAPNILCRTRTEFSSFSLSPVSSRALRQSPSSTFLFICLPSGSIASRESKNALHFVTPFHEKTTFFYIVIQRY